MARKIKPKASLTRLEQERQSKVIVGELVEELDATGQENETQGIKWTQEKGKEEYLKERNQAIEVEDKLDTAKKNTNLYWDRIINEVQRRMHESDPPPRFIWGAKLSEKGWYLWFQAPTGKVYTRGTKICGDPIYDLNAIDRFVNDALNYMDMLSDRKRSPDGIIRSKGGIILPN